MKKKRPSTEADSSVTGQKPGVQATRSKQDSFPIVAIGAAAGGLEASMKLFSKLPRDTGMAFVLIQNLDPKHHSILAELVSAVTKLLVVEVKDGMKVKPNHVYVIPANANMAISKLILRLTPRRETHSQHMPVDNFMRSLAQDHGSKAIGVILSGTASDGTLGLAAIQVEGGITFAQDEKSAKYSGMPRSAIADGHVDFVLPPEGIARELARIGCHGYVIGPKVEEEARLIPEGEMGPQTIFSLLRKSTGIDFSYYRRTTVDRRVRRRMVLHKIEELKDYVSYLQHNPQELQALHTDILADVTSFFRSPEAFEALKHNVFPSITKTRLPEAPLRIWSPACSSGEETYSLAITLLEYLDDQGVNLPIQLFGTDVSEAGIAKARGGTYAENIQVDVTPERLRRFFVRVEGGYRISKAIRDMCIFAQHNLLSDPPFSQMDLVSCRNCLIYLEPILQKKVLAVLHYALKPTGFLTLGVSEGIGTSTSLFATVDRTHKIYSRKWSPVRALVDFSLTKSLGKPSIAGVALAGRRSLERWSNGKELNEFDRALLSKYSPATVLINDDLEVLQSRGDTRPYLQLGPGRASLNILKMVREDLLFDLHAAITRARKKGVPVRVDTVQFRDGNQLRELRLEITPFKFTSLRTSHYMIAFTEKPVADKPETATQSRREKAPALLMAREREIHKLEQELAATREYLHSVVEEQEASKEELQSANEEFLSNNEELQSTNEELQTAKEELQSANEELNTVNEELRGRNAELGQVNNDLINLLNGVNIAMVMLGNDLRVRRFTPLAQKTMGLIPTDVGRPITDIHPRLDLPELEQLLANVSETEIEVRDREGRWYCLRILPYKTPENEIDGIAMMLVDIDALKSNLEQVKTLAGKVEEERSLLEAVLQQMPAGVVIAEAPSGRLIMRNKQFEQIFPRRFVASQDARSYDEYYNVLHPDGTPYQPEERPLARALCKGETVKAEEIEYINPDGKPRILQATAAPIRDRDGKIVAAVVVRSDITERRETEKALLQPPRWPTA